jgi:hypothetical protein
MGQPKIVEPLEVPNVDREKLTDAVERTCWPQYARRGLARPERCVELSAPASVRASRGYPAAVRNQLDHTRKTVHVRDAQAETVFV